MANNMHPAFRFLRSSRAFAVIAALLTVSCPAFPQSANRGELGEIVPTFGAPHQDNKLPEEVVGAFLSSDDVTLYSIDDTEAGKENIRGYKVLGKAKISRNEAAEIIADLNRSLTKGKRPSMCFRPHHAMRAEVQGRSYDLVICYLCGLVISYGVNSTPTDDDTSGNSIEGSPHVINGIAQMHKLPVPRVFADNEIMAEKRQSDYAHWLSVTPQSLKPLFPQAFNPSAANAWPDKPVLRDALAKEYPDTKQRIHALFAWYGSEGFAHIPEILLHDYSFTDLWSEAQSDRLTNAQLEGAAQLFARKYLATGEHNRRALRDGIRKYADEMARWRKIMPASIRPLWKDEEWRYQDNWDVDERVRADEKPMVDALSREYPDRNQRILILFNWYGSDDDDQRIFGRYQQVVADLLYAYSTPELVEALQSRALTEQQLDGATRVFADKEFRHARRAEIRSMPPTLKAALLAHSKKSGKEALSGWMFTPSHPIPGDGLSHPFVRQVESNDDYVYLVTAEVTRSEPQFAAMMMAGMTVDESLVKDSPAGDVGRPCINTGKARYLINRYHVLLFEILADCGNLRHGYDYVICRLGGDLRCAEAPEWYFTRRIYELKNEGLSVDGNVPYPWKNPGETEKLLKEMADKITRDKSRASKLPGDSITRTAYCRVLDPPNLTTVFFNAPNVNGIRDGDEIDMNSSVGAWIKQQSKDPDASAWSCWLETH